MQSSAISSFAKKVAGEVADAFGTLIQLANGTPFYAFVTVPQPTMSLETGGFNTDKTIKVKWPMSRADRPSVGTKLTLVVEGTTFRVETATSLPGSPTTAQIMVTAIRE
jgi:hypothetical protein